MHQEMHILIKDTSWHIWVSQEGHDIDIWRESFLWRNSFVITYATSARMIQVDFYLALYCTCVHMCAVLSYLYPITWNKNLKNLKLTQTKNFSAFLQCWYPSQLIALPAESDTCHLLSFVKNTNTFLLDLAGFTSTDARWKRECWWNKDPNLSLLAFFLGQQQS